ncbi:hypothetical protein HNP46_006103 [Pseudomonas nitritireducens]|uniref:Uncharacterized protein n=1 Tax=Pseudomonas nitroreducens TaxID=46680 RepID=A0A7W7KQL9_PSENT|nr:hypothetical protein [Pseudomonas nitritireducens]MBB4867192.1 hypothetical protein [Pseudomonas nitritireducens]
MKRVLRWAHEFFGEIRTLIRETFFTDRSMKQELMQNAVKSLNDTGPEKRMEAGLTEVATILEELPLEVFLKHEDDRVFCKDVLSNLPTLAKEPGTVWRGKLTVEQKKRFKDVCTDEGPRAGIFHQFDAEDGDLVSALQILSAMFALDREEQKPFRGGNGLRFKLFGTSFLLSWSSDRG